MRRSGLSMPAQPTSSGVSPASPSHCPPNHTAPRASAAICRIDSLCSLPACLCWASSAAAALSMKASDGTMVSTLSFSRPSRWLDVGLDAAVGDRERLAVGQQDHLVRADAVGRELADALVAVGRVVDAEHAGARVVVVLRRIEQARDRAENTPWP